MTSMVARRSSRSRFKGRRIVFRRPNPASMVIAGVGGGVGDIGRDGAVGAHDKGADAHALRKVVMLNGCDG